jgi:hypothetical protein
MNEQDQARFFNEIHRITSDWESPFEFQLQFIADSNVLKNEGRRIMKTIGEYGN